MLTQVQVLRLLQGDAAIEPNDLDWSDLRTVAVSAGVVVRLADALTARRETIPPRFGTAAAAACAGAQRALELVDRLGARCTELGIAHAFLRTAEQYPDGGRVTLLVAAPHTPSIDRQILRDVPAAPRPGTFERRIAGISAYAAVHGIGLHIRHGRLGRFGEHARYARLLIERAGQVPVGPTACRAPSVEDHLLLLAVERVYTRPAFRLADLAWAIPVLRARTVSWDYVFATALSIGMLPTVGAYLGYVNGIHRQVFDRDLIDAGELARFQRMPAPVASEFPDERGTIARAYVRQVGATLESGRWQSAARLSLLPLMAALAGKRRGRSL
jgi:hypothetical protein